MLKLRRGVVVAEDPLTVEIDGERRSAWADTMLLGEMRAGDEVVVNVAARDLGLGSGGFDVVHVNLTRGLDGGGVDSWSGAGSPPPHVMKLNYTSLQHPVHPVELPPGADGEDEGALDGRAGGKTIPVLVLPLHGHLAPAVWAAIVAAPGLSVGYVQTGGGALPGSLSRDAAQLQERGLLTSHVAAGPAYGGEHESISTAGALDAAAALGWEAAIAGPGPGIIGSASRFGHGGAIALDTAHTALALGMPTTLSPRLSSGDPRERHRGLSHHTRTVLELLLAPIDVAAPSAGSGDADPRLAGDLESARGELVEACADRHRLVEGDVDLDDYRESGLPSRTMGRDLDEDPLFFAAPLAAGAALAGAALRGKG